MEKLIELYNYSITDPDKYLSIDIYQHLPTLKKYGEECKHITEMGVRWGASTLAFISAKPEKLISIDIQSTPEIENIMFESNKIGNHIFLIGDTLKIDIEETDLLFIDTLHTYNQLILELDKHENKVKKYIILHDTTTFGRIDEDLYSHASDIIKSSEKSNQGLRTAMEFFLEKNKNWSVLEDFTNNNGLTILKKWN